MELLRTGMTRAEAAQRLGISPHTLTAHLRYARGKTGATSTFEMIVLAAAAENPNEND